MQGKLYIVGTPIGNLSDLSPRAAKTLEIVDFIAAEDTRVTIKILNNLGIKKQLISCHEHNIIEKSVEIITRIKLGESCAVVTDAGMPCISDPGEQLILLCHNENIKIETVPGPTALTTALAASGQITGRFCFEGFLSTNKKNRKEHLADIKNEKRTLIFYEAPHKLLTTLNDMLPVLGDRSITIARELTKLHEEIFLTTISQAIDHFTETSPRGEFVLVIEGAVIEDEEDEKTTLEYAVKYAKDLIEDGSSKSDAAKQAAKMAGLLKSDIYKELIK